MIINKSLFKYLGLGIVMSIVVASCRTVASLGNLMSLKVKLINAWSLSGCKIAVYAALMKKFNMNIMW